MAGMTPVLFRSGRPIVEADIQALAEYFRSAEPGERKLHRLLEAHPAIIGALGFLEFLSEFPLCNRDNGNRVVSDPRFYDRADILAARLDVSADLRARKFANLIELKGASANILDTRSGRRSSILSAAVNQLRDYSRSLSELPSNRALVATIGWDVWRPSKIVIMGSRAEFRDPGQLEQVKQELLETDGVQLILTDELLAIAEVARRGPREPVAPVESLLGMDDGGRFLASLIVASGGLGGFMLARRRLHAALTSYGNIDIREGVPSRLVHVEELRLQPLARKLEIPFAEAVVGLNKFRRDGIQMYGVVKSGIVIADFDAGALKSAFEQRELRNRPLREKALERRRRIKRTTPPAVSEQIYPKRAHLFAAAVLEMFPQLPEATALRIASRATKPKSGRVGTQPSLQMSEAVWLAVAAHAAYEHLHLASKTAARQAQAQVCALLRQWGGPEPNAILRASLRR